jgi:uncharacterized protein (TIGR00369 family)
VSDPVDGRELVKGFLEHSPFGKLVGLELAEVGDDTAVLTLPFKEDVATTGTIVHGGAIGTLVDTAATAAAWATDFPSMPAKWGTASLTVNYLRPADGQELTATARVVRRGRQMCHCTVEVQSGDNVVATGTAVYALAVE